MTEQKTDLVLDQECSRCGGGAHEIMYETQDGLVMMWCCYCGLREPIPRRAVERHLSHAAAPEQSHDKFRFRFGRFKGMTIAEADAQPNGRPYLEWMAKNNDSLKERITEYLAQVA